MFNRFSTGFALAHSSWQVLRVDKQLIVFPILSGLGCLLVLTSFFMPLVMEPQWFKAVFDQKKMNRCRPGCTW